MYFRSTSDITCIGRVVVPISAALSINLRVTVSNVSASYPILTASPFMDIFPSYLTLDNICNNIRNSNSIDKYAKKLSIIYQCFGL
jgi:hypothetical protein